MSVSLLSELEACPRRWALGSAEYPDIWEKRGYPRRLHAAAAAGSVVHSVIELITNALVRAGCNSVRDPDAIKTMRAIGGYNSAFKICIDRYLDRYECNPRSRELQGRTRNLLISQIPEMRVRVQTFLGRSQFEASSSTGREFSSPDSPSSGRFPIPFGTHTEVRFRAETIGWTGFADRITLSGDRCEITDVKTGSPNEEHAFQLRVYALLWSLDSGLNPSGRLASHLTLAYQSRNKAVAVPGHTELAKLESELVGRTESTRTAAELSPPPAKPGVETCHYCAVRHLCDDYWTPETQTLLGTTGEDDTRVDIEALILGRHGRTSWDARIIQARSLPHSRQLLVRTASEEIELQPGESVRILDGHLVPETELGGPAVLTLNAGSEIFRVPTKQQPDQSTESDCLSS